LEKKQSIPEGVKIHKAASYISPPPWNDTHCFVLCLFQSHGHVESEVAKWQKEIDQTERQWLKKLQRIGSADLAATAAGKLPQTGSLQSETIGKLQCSGSAESANIDKLQQNGSLQSATTEKLQQDGSLQSATTGKFHCSGSAESVTTEKLQKNGSLQLTTTGKLQQNGSLQSATTGKFQCSGSAESATTGKPPAAKHRMGQLVSDVHNGGSCEQEGQPFKKNSQAAKSKVIEVGEWSNSGYVTPSECSTVSSDLDFDTDMPVVLPSVKELAKHFSGSTSDSDSSVTKVSRLGLRKSIFSFSSSSSTSSILFSLSTKYPGHPVVSQLSSSTGFLLALQSSVIDPHHWCILWYTISPTY